MERVYVRDDVTRAVHVRVRNHPGGPLQPPKDCGVSVVNYTFLPDLRAVALADLHGGCFSATDAGAVLAAANARLDHEYRAQRDPTAEQGLSSTELARTDPSESDDGR